MPMPGVGWAGGPQIGYGSDIFGDAPRNNLYDPRNAYLPVPGISSGLLMSGMNYDYLPQGTAIMAPQPGPSPLQQIVTQGNRAKGQGGWSVGAPVRIVNLSSPMTQQYNNLVGDIMDIQEFDNHDGTTNLQFSVRCPLESSDNWWRLVWDREDQRTSVSPQAEQAFQSNRAQMAHSLHRENMLFFADTGAERSFPPFIMVDGLPSEKVQPLSSLQRRDPHTDSLPPISRPPIWGPPTQPVPPGAYPVPNVAPHGIEPLGGRRV